LVLTSLSARFRIVSRNKFAAIRHFQFFWRPQNNIHPNPTKHAELFQRKDGKLQPRLAYLPRYFDGLRIRSSRSTSSSLRTARCRLCLTAFMKDRGRNQTCLTSSLIVRQIR
jgi:hypothetical protein